MKAKNYHPTGIPCPKCGDHGSSVVDTRHVNTTESIRRRRECPNGHRYTTYEKEATEDKPDGVDWSTRHALIARIQRIMKND